MKAVEDATGDGVEINLIKPFDAANALAIHCEAFVINVSGSVTLSSAATLFIGANLASMVAQVVVNQIHQGNRAISHSIKADAKIYVSQFPANPPCIVGFSRIRI